MTEKELILRIKAAVDSGSFGKVKDNIGSLGDAAVKVGKVMAVGVAIGAAAAVGVGVAWFNAASDANQAIDQLQASLGVTEADARRLGDVGREVWANNWGESIGEATAAVGQLDLAFQHSATTEELSAATEAAFALRDALGIEVEQSGIAAAAMFSTFGSQGAEAFDIITASTQAAGPAGEDLLDTFKEYSDHFNRLGFEAQEMGAMLVTAVQNGARNTDYAGDAIKEFGIRISDGTLLSKAALETLPSSITSVATAFNSGAVTGKEAFQQIIAGIAEIDDPMMRYQAGVMAFGTKWEDVGEAAMLAMADTEGVLGDVEGSALAAGNAVNQNIGSAFESLKRTALTALLDIGGSDAFASLEAGAIDVMGNISAGISGIAEAFQTGGVDAAVAKLEELTGFDASGFVTMLEGLKDKWDEVVLVFQDEGIMAALSEIVGFDVQPLVDGFILIGETVVGAGKFLLDHQEVVAGVALAFVGLKTAMAINKAVEIVGAALTATKAAWAAYRSGVAASTVLTNLFGTSVKLALGPVGWIILAIGVAVGLLALAWRNNWGDIQGKTKAVVDWVKGIPAMLGAAWESLKASVAALASSWSQKWGEIKADLASKWDGMVATVRAVPAKFQAAGAEIINGLKAGALSAWTRFLGWFKGIIALLPASVKKILGISSPSRVFYELGYWIIEGQELGMKAAAGGLIRTAAEIQGDVIAAFWSADAAAIAGAAVAASAKAAVDAALKADGVVQGKRESASDAWKRYYDEMAGLEDAKHKQNMENLEAQHKLETEAHEAAKKFAVERIELQKRYIEGLLQQQREAEQRSGGGAGGPPAALKNFGEHMDLVESKMADLLALIGFEGSDAMTKFWRAFHDGGQREIETAEELADVLSELAGEVADRYDELGKELEAAQEKQQIGEVGRHETVMRLLNERKAIIDALIQTQEDAELDLTDLLKARERLLSLARESIRNTADAQEQYEERVHRGIVDRIKAQRTAWTDAHETRMAELDAESKSIDKIHKDTVTALVAERDAIKDGFEQREQDIASMRVDLDKLKMDLGVQEAMIQLTELEQKLQALIAVGSTFKIDPMGRARLDERRSAQIDRVVIKTDDQRKAVQQAIDSGNLSAEQLRQANLLLRGHRVRATDVAEIMEVVQSATKDEVDAQRAIVDANQVRIDQRAKEIADAELLLKIDKDRAVEIMNGIQARIDAEELRYTAERARVDALITQEQAWHEERMDFLDELEEAEDNRHVQRMADIAAEAAFRLASLDMTTDQIAQMIENAKRVAAEIKADTEALYRDMMAGAPDPASSRRSGGFAVGATRFADAIASPAAVRFASSMTEFAGAIDLSHSTPIFISEIQTAVSSLAVTVSEAIIDTAPVWAAGIKKALKPDVKHGADDESFWKKDGFGAYGDMRHKYGARKRYLDEQEEMRKPEAQPPPHIEDAMIAEATVETVEMEFGGLYVTGTEIIVQIDGKDFAAQVVKTIVGDAVLLDTLGKPINERAARRAQTGATP